MHGFAVLALLIAGVGLYGTMSYGVARQVGEIGIRMALGAHPAPWYGWFCAAFYYWRRGTRDQRACRVERVPACQSFLFETQPNDPGTLALAGVVLLSAAILAGYAPARRASRIDPLVALRHE